MLNPLKLNLIWMIIEQTNLSITPEFSDSEIVHHLLEKIEEQLYLSTSERFDIHFYIESRISLIRDLSEIQFIKHSAQEIVC